jgi:hypothetical protein
MQKDDDHFFIDYSSILKHLDLDTNKATLKFDIFVLNFFLKKIHIRID